MTDEPTFGSEDKYNLAHGVGSDLADDLQAFTETRIGPVLQLAAEHGPEAFEATRTAIVNLLRKLADGIESA